MKNSPLFPARARRLSAIVAVLATIAFIGGIGVVPASASHAPAPFDHENFLPHESAPTGAFAAGGDSYDVGAPLIRGDFLSDKQDGVTREDPTSAHLTVVATADTDRVQWFVCDPTMPDPVTPAALGGSCNFIGEDPTARQPAPPPGVPIVADEAYEFAWDPTGLALDDVTKDIVSLACNGAPVPGAEPGTHCRADLEEDIKIEVAEADGLNDMQMSAGELFIIDPCDGSLDFGSGFSGTCNFTEGNQIFPAVHGMNVPNPGFAVAARTSTELTAVNFHLVTPADAQTDPATGAAVTATDFGPDATTALFKQWSTGFNPADNAEHALILSDTDNGSMDGVFPGDACDAAEGSQCAMDVHYLVSIPKVIDQVHAHNDERTEFDASGNPFFEDDFDTFCHGQDRLKTNVDGPDPGTEPDPIATGEAHEIIGCVFDNFTEFGLERYDNPATATVPDPDFEKVNQKDLDHVFTTAKTTWELTGAKATFGPTVADDGACDGTVIHDHNNDGNFEHCHAGGGGGFLFAHLVGVEEGTVTGTYCFDDDQDGCADETLKDTITKTITPELAHAHLWFDPKNNDSPLPPAYNALGHAGTNTFSRQAGTVVNLDGFGHDDFHNPVPDGTRVLWGIGNVPGQVNPADPAQFIGTPDQATKPRPADGQIPSPVKGWAEAKVTAAQSASGKNSIVSMCIDAFPAGGNGNCDGRDFFGPGFTFDVATAQIQWTAGGEVPGVKCPGFETVPGTHIVGTAAADTLVGTPGNDIICGLGGNDTIRGLAGDDIILGGDGNDTLEGNQGEDRIAGGEGNDIARGGTGNDVIFGQNGADILFGNEGNDRVSGGFGNDRINLGEGNDRGWGGGDSDRIWGLQGDDVIYGNTGDDPNLRGGPGDDAIVGGSGDDGIVGEQGVDRGYGQSGNDRLFFRDGVRDLVVNGGGGVDLCSVDAVDPTVFCP